MKKSYVLSETDEKLLWLGLSLLQKQITKMQNNPVLSNTTLSLFAKDKINSVEELETLVLLLKSKFQEEKSEHSELQ